MKPLEHLIEIRKRFHKGNVVEAERWVKCQIQLIFAHQSTRFADYSNEEVAAFLVGVISNHTGTSGKLWDGEFHLGNFIERKGKKRDRNH